MDNIQQLRAMRGYAHSMRMPFEEAAMLWIDRGLAKQWREYNV